MFCQKCGSKVDEGAAFCHRCGVKIAGAEASRQAPVESVSTVKSKSAEPTMNQECNISFLPRKVFGQFLIRKAVIDIGGITHMTKFKKPIDFTIRSGSLNVLAYGAFIGKSCKAQLMYNFEPGKQYLIQYKTSMFIFAGGKIKIEEHPIGAVLPKK